MEVLSEVQKEEHEVLQSIYEDDEAFKETGLGKFQYKIGLNEEITSFILEVKWIPDYPDSPPVYSLDLFYNNHLLAEVKKAILDGLEERISELMSTPMTFELFEWLKENAPLLTAAQKSVVRNVTENESSNNIHSTSKKEILPRKEQLTKAQKRRIMDKFGAGGEKERGWDWVCLIRHLSQTGAKEL